MLLIRVSFPQSLSPTGQINSGTEVLFFLWMRSETTFVFSLVHLYLLLSLAMLLFSIQEDSGNAPCITAVGVRNSR